METKNRIYSFFKDDPLLLKEIIAVFLTNGYAYGIFGEIKEAIKNQDYLQIGKLAHKLKGSFSYFRVEKLNKDIAQLENAARERAIDKIIFQFHIIEEDYVFLEKILQELNEEIGLRSFADAQDD